MIDILKIVIVLFLLFKENKSVSKCNDKNHFKYVFTECNKDNRWAVAVPKDANSIKCEGAYPSPKLAKCSIPCDPGSYLEIDSQSCKECPAGTYSMGGTAFYDDWREMPPGFYSTAEQPHEHVGAEFNCSNSGWVPSGEYIASYGGVCTSVLVLQVDLVKDGKVTFEYRYSDPNRMFEFQIENDQCEMMRTTASDKFLRLSEENNWQGKSLHLKRGRNILYWVSFSTDADEAKESHTPTLLRKIKVEGVPFVSKCSDCPPGTYSSQKSSKCSKCLPDTYSIERGSVRCSDCPSDQYSDSGSTKCFPRKECVETDYYEYMEPCNSQNKTRKAYAWKPPVICKVGSVKLPPKGAEVACTGCNPGTYRQNATSNTCIFCPANQYSDGLSPCKKCGENTQPRYEIQYIRWASLPPKMKTECISLNSDDKHACDWYFFQDHIRSSNLKSYKDVYRILVMEIPGLLEGSSSSDEHEVLGKLSVEFEVVCHRSCRVLLITRSHHHFSHVINIWKNNVKRLKFEHEITDPSIQSFAWVFDSNYNMEDYFNQNDSMTDGPSYLSIYSINVTSVSGVGATTCDQCSLGIKNDRCIPCPPATYYSKSINKCTSCPDNTIVIRNPAQSINDCGPCGVGLKAHNGNSCIFEPEFVTKNNYKYDFNKLLGVHNISGIHLFGNKGTTFYHVFNFTLDNRDPKNWPVCSSTLHQDPDLFEYISSSGSSQEVRSLFCRVTIVPSIKEGGGPDFRAKPLSLGDRIVSIKNTNHSEKFRKEINKKLENAGWSRDDDGYDIHVLYNSSAITAACPKGRSTIVTLRCSNVDNANVKTNGQQNLQLPPKCSLGTCDGCNFHFIWLSQNACPVCRKEDFIAVSGECIAGKQTIHYFPPKHCYLSKGDATKKVKIVSCPLLTRPIEIGLVCGAIVCVVLVGTIVHCHKSNKQLQYKYSKLIESSGVGGKDGELPGAESCAVHEGEEDEEDVQVRTGGGGAFFSRIKNIRRPNRSSHDHLESVNLTEKVDYGI